AIVPWSVLISARLAPAVAASAGGGDTGLAGDWPSGWNWHDVAGAFDAAPPAAAEPAVLADGVVAADPACPAGFDLLTTTTMATTSAITPTRPTTAPITSGSVDRDRSGGGGCGGWYGGKLTTGQGTATPTAAPG